MRALGLDANSAGAIRIVKRHVLRLGLDTSHFRGKRTWSDAQLRRSVIGAESWDELLTELGVALDDLDGRTRAKAQAVRPGLDLAHLENHVGNSKGPAEAKPDLKVLAQCCNVHCRVLVCAVRVHRRHPGRADRL